MKKIRGVVVKGSMQINDEIEFELETSEYGNVIVYSKAETKFRKDDYIEVKGVILNNLVFAKKIKTLT